MPQNKRLCICNGTPTCRCRTSLSTNRNRLRPINHVTKHQRSQRKIWCATACCSMLQNPHKQAPKKGAAGCCDRWCLHVTALHPPLCATAPLFTAQRPPPNIIPKPSAAFAQYYITHCHMPTICFAGGAHRYAPVQHSTLVCTILAHVLPTSQHALLPSMPPALPALCKCHPQYWR